MKSIPLDRNAVAERVREGIRRQMRPFQAFGVHAIVTMILPL
jgi:hypothetical protein